VGKPIDDLEEAGPTVALGAVSARFLHHDPVSRTDPLGDARVELDEAGGLVRIDEYRVLEALGRGGMGVVYRVERIPSGEKLALKMVEARFLRFSEDDSRERFEREIDALTPLRHPGVVRIFDSGVARHPMGFDIAYYVMELVEGESLDELAGKHPMEPERAVSIVARVAEAIAYLAEYGIHHRDVKPANIMVQPSGRAVLLDFGLARSEELARLTRTGQIIGTFNFMAPERLEGEPGDEAADVWSLGVMLYTLLTGKNPYGAGSPIDVMNAIRRGVSFAEGPLARPDLGAVRTLLLEMLSVRPNMRPSAKTLVERLRRVESGMRASTGDPTLPRIRAKHEATVQVEQVTVDGADPPRRPVTPTRIDPTHFEPERARPPVRVRAAVTEAEVPVDPALARTARGAGLTSRLVLGIVLVLSIAIAFAAGFAISDARRAPVTIAASPAQDGLRLKALAPVLASMESAEVAYQFALAELEAGHQGSGIAALRRALVIDESHAGAHRELANAYKDGGSVPDARRHYLRYLELKPKAGDAASIRAKLESLR